MDDEIDYEVLCNDYFVAGSSDLDEAISYAHQYREEGSVEVYKVIKKSELIFKASKLRKAQDK